jgi:hypothetical protein
LCLTDLQKTLTLAISFALYELEVWYFIRVFLETKLFVEYQQIWPCDLDLGVWPTYWKLYSYKFWIVCTRTCIFFILLLLVTRPFHGLKSCLWCYDCNGTRDFMFWP